MPTRYLTGLASLLAVQHTLALSVNVNQTSSIQQAARTIASNIVGLYNSTSTTPGVFGEPYYWWESGLAWDSLIKYTALTGDQSYVNAITEGLLFQVGPNNDYLPPNQTTSEGNDDQSFWALAAMTAAEVGFPSPNGSASWSTLAKNVFDEQAARWDDGTCEGGLRWQIFTFNNGYNYKNSLSNGNFVQLAARLARFTGNQTYLEWAQNATQWSIDIGLIGGGSQSGAVYDGTSTTTNCSQINHIQWTAAAGTYISGAAYASDVVCPLLLSESSLGRA